MTLGTDDPVPDQQSGGFVESTRDGRSAYLSNRRRLAGGAGSTRGLSGPGQARAQRPAKGKGSGERIKGFRAAEQTGGSVQGNSKVRHH
jgi:hypothetical protein